MSGRQSVKWTKCQVDKMSSGQNVKWTKCQVDKMSSGHMIKAPKIDNQSFFITNLFQIPLSKFSSY